MSETVRPLPDHDNHHNAAVCPYCTHNGAFVMVSRGDIDAMRTTVSFLASVVRCGEPFTPAVEQAVANFYERTHRVLSEGSS